MQQNSGRWLVVGSLGVRVPETGWNGYDRVVLFDMDSTLIETKSGCVFGKNRWDWRWKYGNVVDCLRTVIEYGFGIVIVSNQLGTKLDASLDTKLDANWDSKSEKSKGEKDSSKSSKNEKSSKNSKNEKSNRIDSKCARGLELMGKIDMLIEEARIGKSTLVLVATGDDEYRKPRIGTWEYLETISGCKIVRAGCIFVGDAAGRVGDHSDTDRKYALNVGITFETPEMFFLDRLEEPYTLSGWRYTSNMNSRGDNANRDVDIDSSNGVDSGSSSVEIDRIDDRIEQDIDTEIVVLIGKPASGKSTLSLRLSNYTRVCQDELKTVQKCIKMAESVLVAGGRVIVDATNGKREVRRIWIDMAKRYDVKISAIVMDVSLEQCMHMNRYREMVCGRKHIPEMVYRIYEKNYEEVEMGEGFEKVVMYKPELVFESEKEKEVFSRWYL